MSQSVDLKPQVKQGPKSREDRTAELRRQQLTNQQAQKTAQQIQARQAAVAARGVAPQAAATPGTEQSEQLVISTGQPMSKSTRGEPGTGIGDATVENGTIISIKPERPKPIEGSFREGVKPETVPGRHVVQYSEELGGREQVHAVFGDASGISKDQRDGYLSLGGLTTQNIRLMVFRERAVHDLVRGAVDFFLTHVDPDRYPVASQVCVVRIGFGKELQRRAA